MSGRYVCWQCLCHLLLQDIGNAINEIVEGIAAFVKKFIDFIDEAIKLLNAFVCGILNGIIGLVQAILMVLAFLVDMAGPDFGYEEYLKRRDMGEKLESVIDFISDSFGALMGAVKDLFTQSADATIDDLKQFLQSIGSLLQQGEEAVENFWDNTSRYQFAY
jgi:phage-related protein